MTHAGPSVVGEAHAFTATVTGASGALTYEWTFGDAAARDRRRPDVAHLHGARPGRRPGLRHRRDRRRRQRLHPAPRSPPADGEATDLGDVDRVRRRAEARLLRQPGQRHAHVDRRGQAAEGRRARGLPQTRVARADTGGQALDRPPGRLRRRRRRPGSIRRRARLSPALRVPARRRRDEPHRRRRVHHADGRRQAAQARSEDRRRHRRGAGRSAAARDRGVARRQGRLRHPLHLAGHGRRGRQGRRGGDDGRDAHPAEARQGDRGQRSAGARRSQLSVLGRAHARRPPGVDPRQEGQHRARQAEGRARHHARHDGAAAGRHRRYAVGAGDLRQPDRSRRSQPAGPRRLQPVRQLRHPDPRGLEPRRDSRHQPSHAGVLRHRRRRCVPARGGARAGRAPVRAGRAEPQRPRLRPVDDARDLRRVDAAPARGHPDRRQREAARRRSSRERRSFTTPRTRGWPSRDT